MLGLQHEMRGHLGEVYTEEVGVTVRAHLRGAGHISTASKAHIHLLTPAAREHTITHNLTSWKLL